MFKKIIFLFLLICMSVPTFAVERPIISSVGYDGFLSDDTIIKIKGKNLEKCDGLSIKGTNILIQSKSDTEITYMYSSGKFNKGFIDLDCGGNKGSGEFVFPYIDEIDADKESLKRVFWINGENLGNGSKVYLELGEHMPVTSYSEVLLIGTIPNNPSSDNIFVIKNGLRSNLYKIKINAPQLSYIEAPNGFIPGNKIVLHGENLYWDVGSYVLIGDTQIKNFKYNEENKTIEFILPDLLGKNDISFVGKGVESNEIEAFVIGKRQSIKNAYIKGEYIDDKYIETLYINGTGFDTNNENIYVYNGNKKIKVTYNRDGQIRVENFKLNPGNNFIYLDINGVYTNIYNIIEDEIKPYITYIEPEKIDGNYRVMKLGLGNFDKTNDYIYYKGSKISPISCLSNSCRVKIKSGELVGYFNVSTKNGKKSLNKYFDISEGKYPVIYNIEFMNTDIKGGTQFKINGINLENANLSFSNFVDKDDKGRHNIDVNSDYITGRLFYNYKSDTNSTISISKYGKSAKLTFKGDDLTKTKLNGHGLIKSITNSKGGNMLLAGETLDINGYGFHNDSKVIVGGEEYPVKYISQSKLQVKLKSDVKVGNTKIQIKNTFGNVSEGIYVYIFPLGSKNTIDLEISKETDKQIKAIEKYTNEFLYSIKIKNIIDDLTISSFRLKIKDYDANKELGTFKLKSGNTLLGEVEISDKGLLEFKDFTLPKNKSGNILSLYKTSAFYNYGEYEIILDKIEGYKRGTNIGINNFDITKLKSFKLQIEDNNIYMCIDSLEDNSNCKNAGINKKEIVKEEKKEAKVISNQEKKKQIYTRVDEIIDNYIKKVSKKSLKQQMDTYKTFKNKIVGIISRNADSPLKEYLIYFHDRIDSQFKIVFKQYFNSKK